MGREIAINILAALLACSALILFTLPFLDSVPKSSDFRIS